MPYPVNGNRDPGVVYAVLVGYVLIRGVSRFFKGIVS